jgi:hypothetical protein
MQPQLTHSSHAHTHTNTHAHQTKPNPPPKKNRMNLYNSNQWIVVERNPNRVIQIQDLNQLSFNEDKGKLELRYLPKWVMLWILVVYIKCHLEPFHLRIISDDSDGGGGYELEIIYPFLSDDLFISLEYHLVSSPPKSFIGEKFSSMISKCKRLRHLSLNGVLFLDDYGLSKLLMDIPKTCVSIELNHIHRSSRLLQNGEERRDTIETNISNCILMNRVRFVFNDSMNEFQVDVESVRKILEKNMIQDDFRLVYLDVRNDKQSIHGSSKQLNVLITLNQLFHVKRMIDICTYNDLQVLNKNFQVCCNF